MKRISFSAELLYDDDVMHGDDESQRNWFIEKILMNGDLILHENKEIGDTVGRIKITEIKIET